MAGFLSVTSLVDPRIFVMTFDGDGNHLWTRQRGGSGGWNEALALQVDCSCKLEGPFLR